MPQSGTPRPPQVPIAAGVGSLCPPSRQTTRRNAPPGPRPLYTPSPRDVQPLGSFCELRRAHKKGGVDLSAFHATQGRRIVDIRDTPAKWAGSSNAEDFQCFRQPAPVSPQLLNKTELTLHMEIACQLYTLRDLAQRDFPAMAREVARIGYSAVELAGYGSLRSAAEVRK